MKASTRWEFKNLALHLVFGTLAALVVMWLLPDAHWGFYVGAFVLGALAGEKDPLTRKALKREAFGQD